MDQEQHSITGTGGDSIAFSTSSYWYKNFTSSPFNLNDFIGFTSTDALGIAKSYGRSKGAVSSRLLSYEEANALKTKASSNTKIAIMLWGTEETWYLDYWLGSAGEKSSVWYIFGDQKALGCSGYDNSRDLGVRPVITVLKSSIS